MALFNVLFDIAARTAKFEQGMTRVERRLDNTAKVFKTIGAATGGALAFAGIRQFIADAVQFGDDLKTVADRMQTTTEVLTRLQYVAEQSDAPFEVLRNSLDKLAKNLSLAEDGSGKARKALADLGVEARVLAQLPIEQQLGVLADAFRKVETPADQIRIAMQLFGEEGVALVPVLRLGAEGLRKLGDEGERLGAVLRDTTAGALADTDNAAKKLTASFRVARAELVAVIATPLSFTLEAWARGITRFREAIGLGDKSPLAALRADLIRVNELMNAPFISNANRNQLNDAAIELSKLIAAYEQADADHDRIMQNFIRREADLAGRKLTLPEVQVTAPRRDRDVTEWLEVRATARKIELGAMEQFYRDLEEDTQSSLERQVAQYEEFKSKLDVLLASGRIDTSQYASRLGEQLDEVLQPIEVTSKRIETLATEASEFWKEAFRGMQGVLADFLFDPFDKGIKGMLRGFIDVIRRMIAEAASAKILDSLFGALGGGGGGSGLLGKLFGGIFRADGGPVERGKPYVVGERGPEWFVPGMAGMIVPKLAPASSAGPSITINNTIDARGSSISRAELNAVVNRSSEVTIAKVRELAGWGRI